jgi:hypothetical protein
MPPPGVRSKNFLHLFQSDVDLFVAIVKMRREPYARCGAIIYEYVTHEEFSRYFPRVGTVNRYSSATFIRIEGSVHSPAAITSALHDALGLGVIAAEVEHNQRVTTKVATVGLVN